MRQCGAVTQRGAESHPDLDGTIEGLNGEGRGDGREREPRPSESLRRS